MNVIYDLLQHIDLARILFGEMALAVWLSNWTVATREYVAQLEDTGEKPPKKILALPVLLPGAERLWRRGGMVP